MKDYHWIEIIIVSLICSFIIFMCHSLEAHDCDWILSETQCKELRFYQEKIFIEEAESEVKNCYQEKINQFTGEPGDFVKWMMIKECVSEIFIIENGHKGGVDD